MTLFGSNWSEEEEFRPFDHWLEDSGEEIGPLSHWNEDEDEDEDEEDEDIGILSHWKK